MFANMDRRIEGLLRSHHVINSDHLVIPHVDDALEWCEEQVLNSKHKHGRNSTGSGLHRETSYCSTAWKDRQEQLAIKSSSSRLSIHTSLSSRMNGIIDHLLLILPQI